MKKTIGSFFAAFIITLLPFILALGFAYLADKAADREGVDRLLSHQIMPWMWRGERVYPHSHPASGGDAISVWKQWSPMSALLLSRSSRTVFLTGEHLFYALPALIRAYDDHLFEQEHSDAALPSSTNAPE